MTIILILDDFTNATIWHKNKSCKGDEMMPKMPTVSSQYVYNEKYVLQGQRETSKDGEPYNEWINILYYYTSNPKCVGTHITS